MSKHTHGPWRYDFEPGYCGELTLANGETVGVFIEEPQRNDARLIAAAPTLLSALRALLANDVLFDGTPTTVQAYDAIRDATGESRYRVWPDGTVQDADEIPYEWMSDDYRIVWAENEEDATNEQ